MAILTGTNYQVILSVQIQMQQQPIVLTSKCSQLKIKCLSNRIYNCMILRKMS